MGMLYGYGYGYGPGAGAGTTTRDWVLGLGTRYCDWDWAWNWGPGSRKKVGSRLGGTGEGGERGCVRVCVAVGIGKLKLAAAAAAAGWVEEKEEQEWQTRVGLTIEQRLSTSLAQPGPRMMMCTRGLCTGGGKLQDARDARLSRWERAGEQCKWARFA